MNTTKGPKRTRSATAPAISAAVSTPNINWKNTNSSGGMVSDSPGTASEP